MKRTQVGLISLALLLAGIGLRLPGLSGYLTPDEHLWAGRTAQFMLALADQDWSATSTSGHPGVTTTWAGSIGVTLRYLLDRPADATSLRTMAEALAADTTSLDYLPWLRLPILVICAVGGVLLFWLSRRLMGDAIAMTAALFVLLDPFWLAHSKIIHLDALLTLTATLAWLSVLLATRTQQRKFYIAAGVAAGLGALTKSPALVLGPLMVGWLLLDRFGAAMNARGAPGERRWMAALRGVIVDCLWVGIPAALTVMLLWPALWIAPAQNIGRVLGLMETYGQTGHELGNFWLGKAVASPGGLFYGAVIVWRTTPLTLIGGALALVFTLNLAWRGRGDDDARSSTAAALGVDRRTLLGLWVFVVWYVVILSLGDKKFDRYLLPIFLVVDLLAAFGWVALVKLWQRGRSSARSQPQTWYALIGALLIIQGWMIFASMPSYLTAYNPMAGGMRTARQVMLVGWGEGMEEAAAFINDRMGSSGARVTAWYGCNVFAPFRTGTSEDICFETPTPEYLYREDVDYIVTYVNQIQRDLLDADVAAKLGAPLFVVEHTGVEQAWVYDWPKPFAHTAERDLAEGWRLLGWEIGLHDPTSGRVELALFWEQAALAARGDPDKPATAWLKDASGEVWTIVESTVTGAENVLPGWDGRPVIAQRMTLQAPRGLPPGKYRVEAAPFASESADLGEVTVQALRLSDLTTSEDPAGELKLAAADGRYGDELALVGYEAATTEAETIVDLLWVVEKPLTSAYKTFLHLAGPADQIIAQQDRCLGETLSDGACAAMTDWAPGDVIRQRLRLSDRTTGRLYVGLYRPETGERLPLSVGDQVIPDGRYPLPDPALEGAP